MNPSATGRAQSSSASLFADNPSAIAARPALDALIAGDSALLHRHLWLAPGATAIKLLALPPGAMADPMQAPTALFCFSLGLKAHGAPPAPHATLAFSLHGIDGSLPRAGEGEFLRLMDDPSSRESLDLPADQIELLRDPSHLFAVASRPEPNAPAILTWGFSASVQSPPPEAPLLRAACLLAGLAAMAAVGWIATPLGMIQGRGSHRREALALREGLAIALAAGLSSAPKPRPPWL
jgi:hypothetical protein